jgi:cell division protein FtsQ
MWDNPRLLNIAAGMLVGIAAPLILAAGLVVLLRSPLFPVRELVVAGEMKRTTRAEVEAAVGRASGGNFFAYPLAELRGALERLPWVRRVELRRVWPDRLEARLEEHQALGRWGDEALVNLQGERFAGTSAEGLPVFIGPAGQEAEMARRYARFSRLLEPLGERLERVVLTPRLAWQLRLSSGLHLMLGRGGDEAESRLARFVDIYPATLGRMPRRHEYVDLRYPNGFALRIPDLKG